MRRCFRAKLRIVIGKLMFGFQRGMILGFCDCLAYFLLIGKSSTRR